MTKRRWTRGSFLIFIIGSLALVLLIYGVVQQSTQPREVDLSTLLADVKSDVAHKQVDTLTVTSDSLILQRAKRLTAMNFMEIMRDLADKGLPQVEAVTGKENAKA